MSVADHLGLQDLEGAHIGGARAAWRRWVTEGIVDGVVDDLVDLPEWALASPDAARAVLGALASMTESEPDAITALVWGMLPGAEKVSRRLRDMSDDIDGLVAGQFWIEAAASYRLTTSNIAGAVVGQTQREVLADLGVGDLAVRRERAMATSVGASELIDDLAWIEPEGDPGPALAEIFHVGHEEGAIHGLDYWLLWALAAEADRRSVPAHRGRMGLTALAVVEAVAAEANLAPRSLRKRAARALDRLIEYVDAREDPERYSAWRAQHRRGELTIWDEMELTLVEAEHERFRLDHPGMTPKQLRVAFNVVLGTRRRSHTPQEWRKVLESEAR